MKLSVVLYTSKTLSDETHPIMLRLFRKGKYFYKSLQISCRLSDWNENEALCRRSFPRYAAFNKIIRDKLREAQQRIDDVVANKKLFKIGDIWESSEKDAPKTLVEVIKEHRSQYSKLNTLLKYNKLIVKLNEYGYSNVHVDAVDPMLIKAFYNTIKQGRKDITVYTYMAVFEASLNTAVERGYISENPFKYTKFKYDKATIKRALSLNDIHKLLAYFHTCHDPSGFPYNIINTEEYALNLFVCSYYLQGLSLVDMAKIKVCDLVVSQRISGGSNVDLREIHEKNQAIEYTFSLAAKLAKEQSKEAEERLNEYYAKVKEERIKEPATYEVLTIETRRTKTNKPVKIVIANAQIKSHIMFNALNKSPDDYLFNIFNKQCEGNEKYQIHRLTYATNQCNKTLNAVKDRLGLNIDKLTLYCARHTYASMLYHKGVSPSLIAQNLGRDIRNIDVYLKQFDDENIIAANNLLT